MSPFEYFKNCYTKKYADFSGRARRSEYWYFMLFSILSLAAIGIIDVFLTDEIEMYEFPLFFMVAILIYAIPSIAVTVRRLHDTNRSGWWYLIRLVPYIGGIVLFVFTLMDSDMNYNQYGPNPKGDNILEPSDHLIDDDF